MTSGLLSSSKTSSKKGLIKGTEFAPSEEANYFERLAFPESATRFP